MSGVPTPAQQALGVPREGRRRRPRCVFTLWFTPLSVCTVRLSARLRNIPLQRDISRGERGDSNPRPPGPQPRSGRHAGRARRCSLLSGALRFSEIRTVTCPVACHEARSLDQPTSVVGTTLVGPTVIGTATIRRKATHAHRTDRADQAARHAQPRYSPDALSQPGPRVLDLRRLGTRRLQLGGVGGPGDRVRGGWWT